VQSTRNLHKAVSCKPGHAWVLGRFLTASIGSAIGVDRLRRRLTVSLRLPGRSLISNLTTHLRSDVIIKLRFRNLHSKRLLSRYLKRKPSCKRSQDCNLRMIRAARSGIKASGQLDLITPCTHSRPPVGGRRMGECQVRSGYFCSFLPPSFGVERDSQGFCL
jgi:hypothetical protein